MVGTSIKSDDKETSTIIKKLEGGLSAIDFRASSASSKTACLPSARPQISATVIEKSLGNRVPNLCQSCVNLCVFVCVLRLGGGLDGG